MGVVSPASPVPALRPGRFDRGLATLRGMGFEVRVAENAREISGHTAGTVEQRVFDLHEMFADDVVRAIVCSIGGYNSNALLDRLDYDLIRKNPKVFMGYSDITALLLGIHTMTGLVTFYGPTIMAQFGERGGLHPYTERNFRKVLMVSEPPGELSPSGVTIHERLEWDRNDTRPRREETHEGPKVVRPGNAEGRVIAGNLCTLAVLAGTRYFPDLDGAILCVEISEEEPVEWADRYLNHLRLLGEFEKAAALVIGRTHPASGFTTEDSLEDLLLAVTQDSGLPIATGFDFGHTDPMFTLPIGVHANVDFGVEPKLELLEAGVTGAG
ncbi:MAG TPA: S66 peptidase family protein [Rubrobacteraceae bacterium]|nr:S66 peptidase family protein [Rubrobacteraceae bacterium]